MHTLLGIALFVLVGTMMALQIWTVAGKGGYKIDAAWWRYRAKRRARRRG